MVIPMACILVIDDEASVRQMVRRILSLDNHTIIEAEDGRKGIDQLKKRQPDLVVTDLFMPNMEGIETIREFRRLKPGIKILATSGGGSSGEPTSVLNMAHKLGADAVLSKPFRAAELAQAVERLLAG